MSYAAQPLSGAFDSSALRLLTSCAQYFVGDSQANPDLSSIAYAFRSQRNQQALISQLAENVLALTQGATTVRPAAIELFGSYSGSGHIYIALCPTPLATPVITQPHVDIELFVLKPLAHGIEPALE
jgi:hypothetical protein